MATGVFVGIDISKDKVDVFSRGDASIRPVWLRTESELKELCSKLCAIGTTRVALEASGGYEYAVLMALVEAGIEVYLVQPARARYFAKSLGQKAKTDAIDAAVLAQMAEVAVESDRPWKPRKNDVAELRELIQRRDQMVIFIDAESKRLRAAKLPAVRESIEDLLKYLKAESKKIKERIEKLSKQSKDLSHKMKALTSVSGVGLLTAAALLAEVPELGTLTRGEVAALVGVAPMSRESGKWTGQRYIVGGRARARRALYMAALVATRWNVHLQVFYQRLLSRGKPKKVALVAVMRKLIIYLNSKVKEITDTPVIMSISG